ncbi:hypothetical protein V8C44DRAFT_322394 [Trichoderma aethiopicum]
MSSKYLLYSSYMFHSKTYTIMLPLAILPLAMLPLVMLLEASDYGRLYVVVILDYGLGRLQLRRGYSMCLLVCYTMGGQALPNRV